MQCPQCQHDNREQAKFCEGCGTRLAAKCAACGTELGPGARFCSECGTPVGGPYPAAPSPASQPTSGFTRPQAYTPQHLAERIISARGALEGERKQVTVLFADLKGSLELLADRDPEEARRILDPVLERMMEAVHRYEGTVNQVLGDGIMALFGAPLAHEDHAVRACYAALLMQESVKQYAEEIFPTTGLRVQIRVGLNSGEVVVRSIGSDLRMDYTAVGQTTHLAARMEQTALPGSILLAPDTLRLVEGYLQVKALGPVSIKGLDAPVEVYEAVGAGLARSRLQAAAGRGFTKFVGRDAELEVLRQTLGRAGTGHGQVVALVGEPGVGKSRLTWEFTHSHRAQGWLVLESGSVSYGKATSWLPVSDLLRTYFRIESADDHRRIRQKVLGRMLDLDRALEASVPALLSLLDVPTDDPAWDALDPPQRRQRTLDAVKRVLLRESQEQPLLLVFEDLHWIDTETQALLDSLVESLPTARLLLLVNYRPEYEHTWHRKTYYQQVRLDPLTAESASELLAALLGDADVLRPLREVLIERTEGNPFFVEESVRTLVESGVLAGERGSYRLARPFEQTQVPATVQAVLAARMDRLPPEDKRLLQAAAVIGKDVPYLLLQTIAELPEEQLHQGLSRLQAAEFLYETSLFPDLEFTFKHALTHEVAYGSLLHERRRTLHARIVGSIEQLYSDRLAEQVERLAHHALQGRLWYEAVRYLRQAGLKAQARSAHREAIVYFERSLDSLAYLPPSLATLAQAVDTRIDLRSSLTPLGQFDRDRQFLEEAEALAEELGDQRRLGWVSAYLIDRRGDQDRGIATAHRALEIAAASGDAALAATTHVLLGRAYLWQGSYGQAADCFRNAAESIPTGRTAERFGLPGPIAVTSRGWLVLTLAERGQFAEAKRVAEEAAQIAHQVQDPFALSQAHWTAGSLYTAMGDLEVAIPLLERGLDICTTWEIALILNHIIASLSYAYALAGQAAATLPLLERLPVVEPSDTTSHLVLWHRWRGMAYLLAGRPDEALTAAGRALAHGKTLKLHGLEAWALHLLGEIATHAEPPELEQAESSYRQALALADELGMRPLAAHCHLGLGTLYHKIGRDEHAQAELSRAAEMYRAMEMTFWLAKAEAILAQVAG